MSIKDNEWLITEPIAHRGLWGNDIIENSFSAYEIATQKKYPIEIDLFISTDEKIYSFHDNDTFRMTGVTGKIFEKNSVAINKLNLNNSNEKIPTLNQILSLVSGKVPLLIEIKNQPNKKVVELILEALKNYNGKFAIQSFNPLYLIKLKKLAPQITRGLLLTKEDEDLNISNPIKRYIIKKMLFNKIIKPDFLSVNYKNLPLTKKEKNNLPVIAWTVTNESIYNKIQPFCNNIIFENFRP